MPIGELFILGFFGKTVPAWLKEFAGRYGLGGVVLFDYSCRTQQYDNNIESPEQVQHLCAEISTLPSAGLGALVTLMAFGFDFSLIALIGIILLIGIVKKNGIMLVDFAIEAQRSRGLAPTDAIREACLLRFRPIMMTTMAALLGGVPLMLGTGNGAELRQPLGYTIVGGLFLSQVLTLYTTPVVYLYMDRLSIWVRNLRGQPHQSSPPVKNVELPEAAE